MIIGIDLGSSSTKIACISEGNLVIKDVITKASDNSTVDDVLELLKDKYNVSSGNISKLVLTGAGSYKYKNSYNVVSEYEATGRGALYLSNLKEGIVVSMGTGTAFYDAGDVVTHVIGTGLGGGTICGLGKSTINISDALILNEMASNGDTKCVDLTIGDIAGEDMPGLPTDITAANFAKIKDSQREEDIVAGIFNMVCQSIGTLSVTVSRLTGKKDVVFVGRTSTLSGFQRVISNFETFYGIKVIIPEDSGYATAIGSCLIG